MTQGFKKLGGVLKRSTENKLRRRITLIVALVVLVAVIAVVIHFSSSGAFRADSNVTAFDLHNIGELATQSGYFTVVNVIDDAKKLGKWSIPFTASKYIFSYDGEIKAGIDFGEIEWEVNEPSQTVTVRLPQTKILGKLLKEDSLKIYDERQSIFTPLTLGDVQASRQEMLDEIEQTARKNGLMEAAGENAKTLVQGFLASSYDPSVYSYVFE